MIKKLRLKFVVINMTIVTMLLSVILGMVYYFTQAQLETQSIQMMQNIALNPLRLSTPIEPDSDVRLPYFAIQLNPGGERLSVGGSYYDLSNENFVDDLIDAAHLSSKRLGTIPKYNLRYCRIDTPRNHYLVFADISSELATLKSLTKICLIIGAVGFLGFLGASILLSGWAVRPVDIAIKRQQEFVADASHELKTPLTVIMTNAQLMQTSTHSEEAKRQSTSNIISMSQQMKALIEQMLLLARADNEQAHLTMKPTDLSKTVSDGILPFEPLFFEQGLQLESYTEPNIRVMGDGDKLRQVLEIFLDNAQKYSSPGGKTWVRLEKRGKRHCILSVADEGPQIPEEQMDVMFERFYRADEARSRTGSYGLGLSIAKSIANAHHARIWAESKNGINTYFLELNLLL